MQKNLIPLPIYITYRPLIQTHTYILYLDNYISHSRGYTGVMDSMRKYEHAHYLIGAQHLLQIHGSIWHRK